MREQVRTGILAGATILAGLGLTQCQPATDAAIVNGSSSIDSIRESGKLIVLTLEGPTTYTASPEGALGYEYDLIEEFADDLGVKAKYVVMDDLDALIDAIEAGEGHIGAAGLTITHLRSERVSFGPAYLNVEETVVCNDDVKAPTTIDALTGVELAVVKGSSYAETLQQLKQDYGALDWKEEAAGSALPLIEKVENRELDCTIADSHVAEYARRLYPDLALPMKVSEDRPLGWIYNDKVQGLDQTLAGWFMEAHRSGYLAELDDRWFGHLDEFDYVEVLRFVERVEQRLPKYRDYFEEAAAVTGFDWYLIAAQAYQESHWDPNAVSPTGVRGLMMLTLRTARELGVRDRTDPRQSVEGGARYLQRMYDRLPEGIPEEDRIWFALAAYNVGMGHVYDARRLAERQGLDKNKWEDVEHVLPLLSRPKYYRTVKHGYARGHEPVRYVERIRDYYGMLRANVPV